MSMKKYIIITLILISSLFVCGGKAQAYTPPIGIPDPGTWGATHPIDGVATSTATKCPNWPASATAGCYYIDNTNASSTDVSNNYGYPNKPRLTLPDNNYSAGVYMELHGGPYATNMNISFVCTAQNPCWFRGTPGDMPIFTNTIRFRDSTYLFIENLEFNGGENGCIDVYGDVSNHVLVRNNKFKNRIWTSNTAAVGITPNQNGLVNDVVVYNNEFSELGDWDATSTDPDFHGVNPDTYGRTPPTELRNVWILNNSFYHISGNGVQVNANSAAMTDYLHHIYVGKNVGHALRQAAFWSKQANHVIMSQNIAYDNRLHGSQEGNGMGYQYLPDNLWLIFNEIYDSSNGIRQSDSQTDLTHNSYIIGNKIYNIHPEGNETYNPANFFRPGQAIALWQGGMNRHIIDNTIDDVHGGIMINYEGPVDISGNIISNIYSSDYHVSNNNARAVTTLSNNLFYDQAGNIRFNWAGAYTSLASFMSGTGKCSGCITGNPFYVDGANRDYHISASSTAIDASGANDVYDTFFSLYGIDIEKDFDDNQRISGAGVDMGAFEYVDGGADITPPNIPTGVSVF